jgi:hypothetical protein
VEIQYEEKEEPKLAALMPIAGKIVVNTRTSQGAAGSKARSTGMRVQQGS